MKTILFFLLTITVCTLSSFNKPSGEWKTYDNPLNHFKIDYPESWDQKIVTTAIAFLSPFESDSDQNRENVNLMLQDLNSQPMTINEFTELTHTQLTEHEATLISEKDLTFAGQPTHQIVYIAKFQTKELKFKQYWFILNKTAYLFTFTAEPTAYNKYEPIGDKIINSFRFY